MTRGDAKIGRDVEWSCIRKFTKAHFDDMLLTQYINIQPTIQIIESVLPESLHIYIHNVHCIRLNRKCFIACLHALSTQGETIDNKGINAANDVPSRVIVSLPMGKIPKTSPALISGGRTDLEVNITLVRPERIH